MPLESLDYVNYYLKKTMMKKISSVVIQLCVLVSFLLFFCSQVCTAATTTVPIGVDTLPNAISNASSGDVLLLLDGSYGSTNQVETIDKSIIIQAVSRTLTPTLNFGLVIDGDGISITLRGLTFNTTVQAVDLQRAAEVNLLENKFETSIRTYDYKITDGDGSLKIIGNHFISNVNLTINVPDCYIAGNNIESGVIVSKQPISIVGNTISRVGSNLKVIDVTTNYSTRIIGNRINLTCSYVSSGRTCAGIYLANSTASVIAGNIINVDFPVSGSCMALHTQSCNGTFVLNNVIYDSNVNGSGDCGIYNSGSDRVTGNIVYGFHYRSISYVNHRVMNNICFNGHSCGTENGNLEADPLFEDVNNFRLTASSLGINAGPVDYKYSDLDRSRNDIGAYGGPWSIEQYDLQRTPGRTAPFVYPIFDSSYVAAGGQLNVKSLGVARLQ